MYLSEGLATPRKKASDPRLKTTVLNLIPKLFENIAYMKSIPVKSVISTN